MSEEKHGIEVRIEGISPLLHHRFPMEKADEKARKKAGTIDYSKEAEESLYKTEEGELYIPAVHIEASMREAAKNFRIQGRGRKTFKDLIWSGLVVTPHAIPLESPGWRTDARPVVIQRARVVRYRPIFDEWAGNFVIEILNEQLEAEIVNKILVEAGQYQGIGDFRPKFGRFIVTRFDDKS